MCCVSGQQFVLVNSDSVPSIERLQHSQFDLLVILLQIVTIHAAMGATTAIQHVKGLGRLSLVGHQHLMSAVQTMVLHASTRQVFVVNGEA